MKFHGTLDQLQCAGIYEIRNIVNGHKYIGSTVNFAARNYKHTDKLNRQAGVNKYLQNAWNKYGESRFIFKVLEILDKQKLSNIEFGKLLQSREQYWINKLNPEYNIRKICVSSNLGVTFKWSEEAKARRRESLKDANIGSKAVVLLDIHTKELKEFKSCRKCAQAIGVSTSTITLCAKHTVRSIKRKYLVFYYSEYTQYYKTHPDILNTLCYQGTSEFKRRLQSESRKNYYAIHNEVKDKISTRQKCPVLQYDRMGNLVREYESVAKAEQESGYHNISGLCRGLRKGSRIPFIFRFKNGGRFNAV